MFIKKLPRYLRPITSTIIAAILFVPAAHAQMTADLANTPEDVIRVQFIEDESGSERIDLSGKLRMLSQRIPAAACNLNAGIAAEETSKVLSGAVAELNAILAALEFGDENLNVNGAEERRKTLRMIEELHTRFAPLQAALSESVDGVPSDEAIQVLAAGNMSVLEMAQLLVTQISGEYSNQASLLQSDALAIDIAGRQRMLTQKISKEVCLILSDVDAAAYQESLGGTMHLFEVSLDALRGGMPEAGVQPPRTDDIAAGLEEARNHWQAIKGHLDAINAGETIDDAARAAVFLGLNTTMASMNRVVGLYSDASKLGL